MPFQVSAFANNVFQGVESRSFDSKYPMIKLREPKLIDLTIYPTYVKDKFIGLTRVLPKIDVSSVDGRFAVEILKKSLVASNFANIYPKEVHYLNVSAIEVLPSISKFNYFGMCSLDTLVSNELKFAQLNVFSIVHTDMLSGFGEVMSLNNNFSKLVIDWHRK